MFLKTAKPLLSITIKKLARDRREIVLSCASRIRRFSDDSHNEYEDFSLGDRYSKEERDVILRKVNNGTTDELKRYRITELRLKKVIAYRDKYGPFKSLEEILLLQGMDPRMLETFCKSIVKNKSAPKPKTFNVKGELLNPVLAREVIPESKTYLGIWIWGTFISWAQMDVDLNLLHWQCRSLDDAIMKQGLIATINAVADVISNVPTSDMYIMETNAVIPLQRLNSATYSLYLQKQQITSAVVTILGSREKQIDGNVDCESLINNVHMMRPRTPARLYNLLVGSEVVSAAAIVAKLINNNGEFEDDNLFNVYVKPDVKEYYRRLDNYQREQMNWALLLTTAFLDLYVLQISKLKNIGKNRQQSEMT